MVVSIRRVLFQLIGGIATGLKGWESRLRPGGEPESDWRRLYDAAPVMRAATRRKDGSAVITSCNALFAHTLGYEVKEVIGRPITDFYSSRSVEDFRAGGFQRALEGVFQAEERWLATRAGAEIHTLLRASPIRDASGEVTGTDGVFVDVTDREKAIDELRRIEARQRLYFENINQVIYVVGGSDPLRSKVEMVGDRVAAIFGYGPREFYEDPGLWFSNVHPDDMAGLAESTQRIIDSSKPGVRTYRFRHKLTGEWLWVEDTVTPSFDRDGALCGMVGAARDVTAQKEKESRLLLLSRVVQSAGDCCMICSAEGLIEYVNPAFTAATGYQLDEVKGKPPSILKSGRHGQAFYDGVWATITAGKVFRAEFINRKKNGELFYEDKTISPVFDEQGKITHYISVGRDVSERKRVDDELRASERRYRNLIANASDMIFTHTCEGRLLSLNGAGEQHLGLSGQEWWKTNIYEVLGEGYRSEVEPLARQGGNGARSKSIVAVETILPDGRTIIIEPTVRVTGNDGEGVRVEVIARDITERLRLEAQLRQSQKVETLGRLAGGVAHDFNNLLTVILGFGQLARDRMASHPEAAQMIGEVLRAGERGAALARQLLAFNRQQVLHPRLVDIHALMREMVPMLGRLIGEQTRIDLDFSAAEAVLLVDPGQFEQVIINLAVNARDAMPNGGRITISTGNQAAEAGEPACLLVRVRDSGVGIDERTLARVFDPFFTTKTAGRGTGLGLSIVKGIVEQSGGAIEVESRPGQGTCFVVQIPCAAGRPEKNQQNHHVEVEAQAGIGGRILLAEDEPEVRQFFERVLTEAGYEVVGVPDGQEALALASQKPRYFDLLISDVVMPGVSGAELARALLKLNPMLKVLFLTGYAEHSDLESLQKAGLEIEAKPITRVRLLERVAGKLNARDRTAAVLVVDDDPAIRELLRGSFEREGHSVLEAGDGGEALTLLESYRVDAVVTDLSMPGKEGIETIREMRRRRPDLVIVALSGQSASLRAASLLGADAALSKPGDTMLAVATVQRLLRRGDGGSAR